MKLHYNKQDDILFIEFNDHPVIRDISYGWNVNVGFTDQGIGQITILDANADRLFPLEIDDNLSAMLYQTSTHTRSQVKEHA